MQGSWKNREYKYPIARKMLNDWPVKKIKDAMLKIVEKVKWPQRSTIAVAKKASTPSKKATSPTTTKKNDIPLKQPIPKKKQPVKHQLLRIIKPKRQAR
eukprot:UN33202